MFKRQLIHGYIFISVLPYFCLALVFLSMALFVQQTSRLVEITGLSDAPLPVILKLFVLLLPNILLFSVPAATLAGVVIGLGRMGGDSELVAIRAVGVSNSRLLLLPLTFGALLSLSLLYLNFVITPLAARQVRAVAAQAGLAKLESPVEPRTFYAEMPGKVLFVREGDKKSGRWGRVFLHWRFQDDEVRLITARAGRIDTSGEQAELVLNDAEVLTLPDLSPEAGGADDDEKVTAERSSTLRMSDERLDLGRKSLLRNLDEHSLEPEEMGLQELSERARAAGGTPEGEKLAFVLHRRLALCFAPLIFSLLGAALGLKAKRGGRGAGVILAIFSLVAYYLITVGGENLWKSGVIEPLPSAWLANALSLLFGAALLGVRADAFPSLSTRLRGRRGRAGTKSTHAAPQPKVRLTWGITDRYILSSLCRNFLSAFTLLLAVFLVFTLFDLLRFIAGENTTAWLLARYLFFVLPYASMSLAPTGLLVAILATYAVMARRSEAVAWWAGGQSVYRLALPGILFALALCAGMGLIQEGILPQANRIQNRLRAQIRGGAAAAYLTAGAGRLWLATPDQRRIYTYVYDQQGERLLDPVLFEFDAEGVHLTKVVVGREGTWEGEDSLAIGGAREFSRGAGVITQREVGKYPLKERREQFKPTLNTPAEMSFKQLSEHLKRSRLRSEGAPLALIVARERKRSDPFSPIVLAFIGIPLAFAYGRRNAIIALCIAVVIALLFWGLVSAFYYMSVRGGMPPSISAWSPAAIFGAVGIYLFTRART